MFYLVLFVAHLLATRSTAAKLSVTIGAEAVAEKEAQNVTDTLTNAIIADQNANPADSVTIGEKVFHPSKPDGTYCDTKSALRAILITLQDMKPYTEDYYNKEFEYKRIASSDFNAMMESVEKLIGKQETFTKMVEEGKMYKRTAVKSLFGAKNARKFAGAFTHKLDWDAYLAIAMWTKPLEGMVAKKAVEGVIFDSVNNYLRTGWIPELENYEHGLKCSKEVRDGYRQGMESIIFHLLRGMAIIGPTPYAKLYRRERNTEQLYSGDTYVTNGITATTVADLDLPGFRGSGMVRIVFTDVKDAYPISSISLVPHEKEVLIPPYSSFKIIDRKQLPNGGDWVFTLQQTSPANLVVDLK